MRAFGTGPKLIGWLLLGIAGSGFVGGLLMGSFYDPIGLVFFAALGLVFLGTGIALTSRSEPLDLLTDGAHDAKPPRVSSALSRDDTGPRTTSGPTRMVWLVVLGAILGSLVTVAVVLALNQESPSSTTGETGATASTTTTTTLAVAFADLDDACLFISQAAGLAGGSVHATSRFAPELPN